MDVQLLLAAWGAGLSTVLALLALRGWRVDRPALTVGAACSEVAPWGVAGDGQPPHKMIKVSIANEGRRPTTVVTIGATDFARKTGSAIVEDLCVLLAEGAHHVEAIDHEGFARRLDVEPGGLSDTVRYIWVRDAAGRQFRSAEFPLRQ